MTEHRAVPTATAAPDADLVVAARTGDQHAFAAIYDRYADRVFSLCVTLTRDRGIAEDAMADTFLVAWQRLDQLRDPDRLRAWLFAIARNRVTRLGARAGRETPTDTMADGIDPATTTATDAVAETVVERVDADADAAVVWEAASALNPNERALLELSVRQGLDGLDLAAALGMTRHHVNVVAGRMRTNLEQGVAALDLLRREPGRCPALDDLVAGFDGVFTPAWRKRIARHARSCPTCGDQRSRTPVAAFGAVPLLLAPVSARAEILDSLPTSATGAPVVDHSSFRADRHGFPARPYPKHWINERLEELLVILKCLRAELGGRPIKITSGYRPEDYNRKIGGSRRSQHVQGRAVDIVVSGVSAKRVHDTLLQMHQEGRILLGGLGSYPTFTHLDIRPNRVHRLARWGGTRRTT